jgi:hypothetical protein
MPFVILVILVAGVAAWVIMRKKKRTRESLKLTLAVVGFETSGKTVFAGSMFNALRVPDASGVFLDTTPENAGKLLALYTTTADTDKKFPSSTNKGELVEWPFTVKVKSAAAVTDIGQFSYLDFAGESLRDLFSAAPNPETQRLYARFQDADIMIAVLDGLHVKRFMEGRPPSRFYDDLGTLLSLLSNHQKPVNLILTKWDLLEDHYTFRQVAERLLQIGTFANFVRSQRVLGTCRLIPVSSVGSGFVREDGNMMRKIPGKVINPFRVETPIACALPDALTAQQRKPATAGPSKLLTWAKAMKLNLGLLQIDFSSFGSQTVTASASPVHSAPVAIGQLIRFCVVKVGQLERDFPESDLVAFMYRQGL